ncbi:maltotransferase domain-containing protein, partial [Fibrobacterota bacterium]
DLWKSEFPVPEMGSYEFTVSGWVDLFKTWQAGLRKKHTAGMPIEIEFEIGASQIKRAVESASAGVRAKLESWLAGTKEKPSKSAVNAFLGAEITGLMYKCRDEQRITTYEKVLRVAVDRKKAGFSAWYELFPRSWSGVPGAHGTFRDCERMLPEIAGMGFDVIYLPPIHPIGRTKRKGRNNSVKSQAGDPGSPWAIGSAEGGHKAVHPELGTVKDFQRFVKKAADKGLEVAIDIAFQCSLDHPYIKAYPQWFLWRPDGTVQYAENPPKKYEDIVPINFETDDRRRLWEELKSIFVFWIKKGVRMFRVDNPHTKPFAFWEWLIGGIKEKYPDVLFLSEAFTRPKIMYQLAKLGFTQSYTYYTWRNSKGEFTEYLKELTQTGVKDFFRPNFWPNTPDILAESLQGQGRPAFIIRLVLAATMSSNYGIYGPAFELCLNQNVTGKEEYLDSEKYEIKTWNWDKAGNIKDVIAMVNRIRRENPSLQTTWNIEFCRNNNPNMLSYVKATESLDNIILVAVNLDPENIQSCLLSVPLEKLGMEKDISYVVSDLLNKTEFTWRGEENYVELDPKNSPAHIFRIDSHVT